MTSRILILFFFLFLLHETKKPQSTVKSCGDAARVDIGLSKPQLPRDPPGSRMVPLSAKDGVGRGLFEASRRVVLGVGVCTLDAHLGNPVPRGPLGSRMVPPSAKDG